MLDAPRIAKLAALANLPAAILGFLFIGSAEGWSFATATVICGLLGPLPPLAAGWLAAPRLGGRAAPRILAAALVLAAATMAAAVISVLNSTESLAGLLLVFVSLFQTAVLALLVPILWLIGRRAAA